MKMKFKMKIKAILSFVAIQILFFVGFLHVLYITQQVSDVNTYKILSSVESATIESRFLSKVDERRIIIYINGDPYLIDLEGKYSKKQTYELYNQLTENNGSIKFTVWSRYPKYAFDRYVNEIVDIRDKSEIYYNYLDFNKKQRSLRIMGIIPLICAWLCCSLFYGFQLWFEVIRNRKVKRRKRTIRGRTIR